MAVISIILPFKNEAPYIEACIESILSQDYQDWELIMVDDHSTDGGPRIAKEYALKDSRIQYFLSPGSGVIDALREGFLNSQGAYISRMDADDICTKHKLSSLHNLLEQSGRAHLAVGQVQYFSEGTIGDGYLSYEKWLNELTAKGRNFKEIYKECVIPSPCWMVHRDDFEKCGAFDSDRMPEDYDLAFRFLKGGLSVIGSKDILLQWRDHPLRSSRNAAHYSDNSFIDLKCFYFLDLDYDPQKGLCIWGGGQRAKKIAAFFNEKKISFRWFCNNENKIGHSIYGIKMESTKSLLNLNNVQIIVTVSNRKEQSKIRHELNSQNINDGNIFWFC